MSDLSLHTFVPTCTCVPHTHTTSHTCQHPQTHMKRAVTLIQHRSLVWLWWLQISTWRRSLWCREWGWRVACKIEFKFKEYVNLMGLTKLKQMVTKQFLLFWGSSLADKSIQPQTHYLCLTHIFPSLSAWGRAKLNITWLLTSQTSGETSNPRTNDMGNLNST